MMHKKLHTISFITLLLLLIGLRVVYFVDVKAYPGFSKFIFPDDQEYYDRMARSVASGNLLTEEKDIMRGPGYIYFAGLIYALTDNSNVAVCVVQFLFGIVTGVMIYLIGRFIMNAWTGLVAGFLYCLYFPVLLYEGAFLMTSLLTFLMTLGLYLFIKAQTSHRRWFYFFSGLSYGGAVLCRPNMLLLPFVVVVYMLIRKCSFREVVLFLSGVVCLYPFLVLRNYFAGGELLSITTQGKIVLLAGHWHSTDGIGWSRLPYEEELLKNAPSLFDFFGVLIANIREHFFHWIYIQCNKLYAYFYGYEFPQFIDFYLMREVIPLFRMPHVYFGLLSSLALTGICIIAVSKMRRKVFLLMYFLASTSSVVAFYIISRFRQPFIPLFCVAGGIAIVTMVRLVQERKWKNFVLTAVLCAALMWGVNVDGYWQKYHNDFQSIQLQNRANLYISTGKLDLARRDLLRALNMRPSLNSAQYYLGVISFFEQNFEQALGHLEQAWAMGYRNDHIAYLLGLCKQRSGDFDNAVELYIMALEYNPNNIDVLRNLAGIYVKQNNMQEALKIWQYCIETFPDSFYAYYNLSCYYANRGRFEQAYPLMLKARNLNPGHKELRQKLDVIEKKMRSNTQ